MKHATMMSKHDRRAVGHQNPLEVVCGRNGMTLYCTQDENKAEVVS